MRVVSVRHEGLAARTSTAMWQRLNPISAACHASVVTAGSIASNLAKLGVMQVNLGTRAKRRPLVAALPAGQVLPRVKGEERCIAACQFPDQGASFVDGRASAEHDAYGGRKLIGA